VLTGMALPCILFPSALTNSIASMMLPTVAEYQSKNSNQLLTAIIKKVLLCCFILGILCGLFFIICGSFIGNIIFHSTLSGQFIMTLAWMCPFLYCNGNLISIINGLGHTTHTLFINCIGLTLRILSVFYLIPFCGIRGYLTGLLFSQISIFLLCIIYLRKIFTSLPKAISQ
jgi:stage V sporulation protein B